MEIRVLENNVRIDRYLMNNTDYQLTAVATNPVSYHSANAQIATVDAKGLVHAVNPGAVYIVAKTKTAVTRCKVIVLNDDKNVKMPAKHKKRVAIRRITKKNKLKQNMRQNQN